MTSSKKAGDSPKRPQHDEIASVGPYRVKTSLGEGVNGAVRLGVHQKTGRKVALKFVSKAMKPAAKVRLDREIRFMTLLRHPHIVRMYEVIETETYFVLVLQRVRKGELLKYITDHSHLTEKQFRPMFRQILSALSYCHHNNVVHRDMKPENVLLDDNQTVMLIDFGLSNMYQSDEMLSTYCGSPKYAAPEIVTGTRYVGPSVDVWSTGVILFAALTGRLPFRGASIEATYQQILRSDIPFPQTMSASVKDLISKMLIKEPDQRISIDDAIQHPWTSETFDGPPSNFLPLRPTVVPSPEEDIMEKLLDFGYEETEAREALASSAQTVIKSTYFLLGERKRDIDIDEPEDPARSPDGSGGGGVLSSLADRITNSNKIHRGLYDKDGFNLDLLFVTSRLILFACPVEKPDGSYINSIDECERYFNGCFPGKFKIINLCQTSEQPYPPTSFQGHVHRFPTSFFEVPPVKMLLQICSSIDEYMKEDPARVIAIHSAPDIRFPSQDLVRDASMLVACCWLLFSREASSANEALRIYLEKLFPDRKDVYVPPSTLRYINYFEVYTTKGRVIPETSWEILQVELTLVPDFDIYGGCEPILKIWQNDMNPQRVLKLTSEHHYKKKDGPVLFNLAQPVAMKNDMIIGLFDKDPLGSEEMFSLFLNMDCVDSCHVANLGQRNPPQRRQSSVASMFKMWRVFKRLSTDHNDYDDIDDDDTGPSTATSASATGTNSTTAGSPPRSRTSLSTDSLSSQLKSPTLTFKAFELDLERKHHDKFSPDFSIILYLRKLS